MDKPGKLIMALRRRARQAKTTWERRELLERARDIASSAARAEYREKVAALPGNDGWISRPFDPDDERYMAGAF